MGFNLTGNQVVINSNYQVGVNWNHIQIKMAEHRRRMSTYRPTWVNADEKKQVFVFAKEYTTKHPNYQDLMSELKKICSCIMHGRCRIPGCLANNDSKHLHFMIKTHIPMSINQISDTVFNLRPTNIRPLYVWPSDANLDESFSRYESYLLNKKHFKQVGYPDSSHPIDTYISPMTSDDDV